MNFCSDYNEHLTAEFPSNDIACDIYLQMDNNKTDHIVLDELIWKLLKGLSQVDGSKKASASTSSRLSVPQSTDSQFYPALEDRGPVLVRISFGRFGWFFYGQVEFGI